MGSVGEREERLAELTKKFEEMMEGKVSFSHSLAILMHFLVIEIILNFSHSDPNSFQGVKWGRVSGKEDLSIFRSLKGPGKKVKILI